MCFDILQNIIPTLSDFFFTTQKGSALETMIKKVLNTSNGYHIINLGREYFIITKIRLGIAQRSANRNIFIQSIYFKNKIFPDITCRDVVDIPTSIYLSCR